MPSLLSIGLLREDNKRQSGVSDENLLDGKESSSFLKGVITCLKKP